MFDGFLSVMKPSTPYFIYAAKNTIWETHYFYCGGLMQESFHGIILHFLYSKRYSRESRPNFLKLILRMIQFHYLAFIEGAIEDLGGSILICFLYLFTHSLREDPARVHLPTFTNMDSVSNFLCMCSIGILSNVLDPRTYTVPEHVKSLPNYRENSDMNGIPEEERLAYIHIRAQSFCLISWFSSITTH